VSLLHRVAAVLVLAPLLAACGPPPAPAPHVLLVTVDTLRPDYLGVYGQQLPTSPTLDRLLADATVFERALAPVGRTTPSLASLMTGAYPHRTGVRRLTNRLRPQVRTLAEILWAETFQTRAVVTNHVLDPRRDLDRGFKRYVFHAGALPAARLSDLAEAELRSLDPKRPAFVWLHYLDPHEPYAPPEHLVETFSPGYDGPYRTAFALDAHGDGNSADALGRGIAAHRNPLPEHVNAHIRRLYAASIRSWDDELERVVRTANQVWGDDWVLVFTADHGESLGEHDYYWDHGDYVYNAGTRIPLAIRLPPSHPWHGARRCSEWVSLVDVTPTLVELLGLTVPPAFAAQLEGRSLVPCLRGEPLPEQPVFAESGHSYFPDLVRRRVRHDISGRFRAVVRGDWKLIWTPYRPGDDAYELYDVRNDPAETQNLYDPKHPAAAQLEGDLRSWLARAEGEPTPPEESVDPRDLEALRAMGYIE